MEEYSEPLRTGAKLPVHPADTTARKVISYGEVSDSRDGHILTAGLHRNEIQTLKHGGNPALSHLYRYAIQDGCIYHTRSRVTMAVTTTDVEPNQP